MQLVGYGVVPQIYRKGSNIPITFDSAVNYDEKKEIGLHYSSGLAYSGNI